MCLGLPGRVVEVKDGEFPAATVEVAGARRIVQTGLLAEDGSVAVGEWLLIHAGFALERLDEEDAELAMATLAELAQTRSTASFGREAVSDEAEQEPPRRVSRLRAV